MVIRNKKKIWLDFDMDIQIGFSITLFLHGEDELHELVISFMCFNLYIYWWNKGSL